MIRTTQLTIAPKGEPIFSEKALTVSIEDVAAGEFILVTDRCDDGGTVGIDPRDWPELCDAINQLVKEINSNK